MPLDSMPWLASAAAELMPSFVEAAAGAAEGADFVATAVGALTMVRLAVVSVAFLKVDMEAMPGILGLVQRRSLEDRGRL